MNPSGHSKPPAARWLLLQSGPRPPAENMACDEALLEFVVQLGQPVLRFYGWTEPAATFGYFQRQADVAALTGLRPLIRRPTGGGLVPHDVDWTYSVAVPPGDPWYELKAVESYRRVHEWVQAAFSNARVSTELSPCCVEEGPGQCFVGAERFDLLWEGRKIAGAAQRRRRDGLLIQGSIQAGATGANRREVEQAFQDTATGEWGIQWESFPVTPAFRDRVCELVEKKYSRPEYNEGR